MRSNKKMVAFMVVFVAAALIFCIKMVKSKEEQTLTVTDCYGMTYLAIIDENQNVYAGVTDLNGDLYGARIDENGEVVLDGAVYPVEGYTGTLPYNNTTAVDIDQTVNTQHNYGAEVSRLEEDNAGNNGNEQESPGNSQSDSTDGTTAVQALLTDKYRKLFESGTYVMVFSTDDPEIPGEVTSAFKNGNICVDTTVEGMDCQVIYRADENVGWIVIPSIRTYCELPQDMAMEMSGVAITSDDDYNYTSVEVYNVTISSKTCVCEDYSYEDGSRKCYYFDSDENLVRMDLIDENGNADIYSISKISSTVEDSYFEKPRAYMKLDLSWLTEEDLASVE